MFSAKKILDYKIFIILASLLLITTACQKEAPISKEAASQGSQAESRQTASLPEIPDLYSPDVVADFHNRVATHDSGQYEGLVASAGPILREPDQLPSSLFYDSGIHIQYPQDGVKGLYLTASNVANPEYLDYILQYIDQTDLNSVVIDFKDDWGNIVTNVETDNPLIQENMSNSVDMKAVLKKLEEKQIYPIARIVTFKDNLLSDLRPDLSFVDTETGGVWQSDTGSQFINPFLEESWNYNLEIAAAAAKMGFKEIQFDYIRFPEGFETFSDTLDYNIGNYASFLTEDPELKGQERIAAINDFLDYADSYLAPYGVDISADVFGYTAIAGNAPDVRGIGQNFNLMAERVDIVSSMIYPSHWGYGFFGLDYPDLYPYELVSRYMAEEDYVLDQVEDRPTSRPWLQDFTASYLQAGTWMEYGPNEVQAQINALFEHGVHEFLLWNALGEYTQGVDYSPDIKAQTEQELLIDEEYQSNQE